MTIDLFVTDIDGTLLRPDRTIDKPRLNRLIDQLHRQGKRFAIASANHLGHVEVVLEGVNGVDAIIAENGAQIQVAGQLIHTQPLPQAAVEAVLAAPALAQVEVVFLSGQNGTYIENRHAPLNDYFVDNEVAVDDLAAVSDDLYKIDLRVAPRNCAAIAEAMRQAVGHTAEVVVSDDDSIDIMALGVDKGEGVRALAAHFDLPLEAVAAFGDNENDLPMLSIVGAGYAMKNAGAAIQAKAPRVTALSNADSGVLATIEALISE